MKNLYQSLTTGYLKIALSLSILVLVISIMSFIAYDKSATEADDAAALKEKLVLENRSSVICINGVYKIDSTIAIANWNRDKLVSQLEKENLVEKKTIDEIPNFIKAFLDSISINKTFDMANPGEAWQEGGWVNGFDNQNKTIVNGVNSVAKPFPSKQLVYCGLSKNMALISYFTGGIRLAQHVMMIKLKEKTIVNLWFNNNWRNFDSDFDVVRKDSLIKYIKVMNNNNC